MPRQRHVRDAKPQLTRTASRRQPEKFSTTVYWHNRCSTSHKLEVQWDGRAYSLTKRTVPAGGSGSTWTTSDAVKAVIDLGH